MRCTSRGRSDLRSIGTLARSSGEGGVSWKAFSRSPAATISSRCAALRPRSCSRSRAASSAVSRSACCGSGRTSSVVRCGLAISISSSSPASRSGPAGGLLLELLHPAAELQGGLRRRVVQPAPQAAAQQAQGVRPAAPADLAVAELHLVDGRPQALRLDPLPRHPAQGLLDQPLHLLHLVRVGAAQPGGEHHLLQLGVQPGGRGQVLPQAGLHQRPAQRGAGVAQQHLGEHLHAQQAPRVQDGDGEPVDGHRGAALEGVVRLRREGLLQPAGRGPARLLRDPRVQLQPGETLQEVLLEELQVPLGGQVAVQEDAAVGGVVVQVVEAAEPLVVQLRDAARVASRLQPVGGVGEQGAHRPGADHALGGGEDPLHLVEDHPGAQQAAGGTGRLAVLQVVPLLHEDLLPQQGEEHRVAVDQHQVVEVLLHLGAARVDGLVRVGHGVEEGVQAGLQHQDEGVLQREAARAGQHGVLQDVRLAGVVPRRGAEVEGEEVLLLPVAQVQDLAPRGPVPQVHRGGLVLGELALRQDLEDGFQFPVHLSLLAGFRST